MSNNERVTVSTEIMNKALGVLSQRPYMEVAGIISELQADVRPIAQGVVEEDDDSVVQEA
jgi:hypothetical protein